MKARCFTLNLKGIGAKWFEARFDALISQLGPLQPDVACFQESTVCYERGKLYNQARAIGEAIGLPVAAFAPYGNQLEVMSRERGGVAIVSRWPIVDVRPRRLCTGHDQAHDSRVALFATLHSPEGNLEVATTHLSWRPEESEVRMMQTGMLLQELLATQNGVSPNRVVMGDFNATDDEPAIRLITEHFQDAYRTVNPGDPGYTWDNDNPHVQQYAFSNRRVDYVFCPKDSKVELCKVVLNEATPIYPSDHYGLLAELEW